MENMQQKEAVSIIEIDRALISVTFGQQLGLGYGSIHAPEQTIDEAQYRAEKMRGYFVEVDPDMPSDCIDGRHSKSLLDGSLLDRARPGVAGGAAVTGYAAAELTGYFGESTLPPRAKFVQIVERLESSTGGKKVIKAGGHVDEDAVSKNFEDGKTGCGAADKLIGNIAFMSTVNLTIETPDGLSYVESDEDVNRRLTAVRGLTKAVVSEGGYYTYEDLDNVIESLIQSSTAITTQAKLEGWSGVIMKEELAERGEKRLVVLETTGGGVHGHTERKVLFNFIDDATFNQDGYYDATLKDEGIAREVFDVDVWHIRDIANALADSPDETQPGKLFAAGVAMQIATYLGLCDGSHRPFFAKTV